MPFVIENMLTAPFVAPEEGVLLPILNQEVTDQCRFTAVCGEHCVLNISHINAGPAMPAAEHWKLAKSVLQRASSEEIGTYALAGKEPGEEPALVAEIICAWHARPESKRPRNLAMVTSSTQGLRAIAARISRLTPLPTCFISVDHDESGLRNGRYVEPLLAEALDLRRQGLVRSLCVNTTFRANDHERVLAIGERMAATGLIDQWSAGIMLKPGSDGKLGAVVSPTVAVQLLDAIAERFAGGRMATVLSVDAATFQAMPETARVAEAQADRWRFVHDRAPSVIALALNQLPWVLARARWDGEFLSCHDFIQAGSRRGSLGRWPETDVDTLLQRIARLRCSSSLSAAA